MEEYLVARTDAWAANKVGGAGRVKSEIKEEEDSGYCISIFFRILPLLTQPG